jgi:hypothetical protein
MVRCKILRAKACGRPTGKVYVFHQRAQAHLRLEEYDEARNSLLELIALRDCITNPGDRRERGHRPVAKNLPMLSFRNLASVGLLARPAVCPHSDGIGVSVIVDMNPAS